MSKKRLFLLSFVLFLFAIPLFFYISYIDKQKLAMQTGIYANEVAYMQKSVASMIEEKKKATAAIAITLASNDALHLLVNDAQTLKTKLSSLVVSFRKNTYYKNIWFHVVDRKYRSLCKSWTDVSHDICKEEEFHLAIEQQKVVSVISIDQFGISIKSIAPFYDNKGEVAGAVEVISHFNSIAKRLKALDIESVVAVNKELSKQIKHPFTKHFIDGYYIANFDIPSEVRSFVEAQGVEKLVQKKYQVHDGFIIVAYALKDVNGKTIAHYIMLKKIENVSKTDLEFFLFKGIVVGFGIFLLLLIALLIYFYVKTRRLKQYYRSIIDSTTNMLLICEEYRLIDVNRVFFTYFKKYTTLEAFLQEHSCISDFFVQQEGYLEREMDGENWIDYIHRHPNFYHKAKLLIDENTFYFSISLSEIEKEQERQQFSIVLSDITEQELYKHELEDLTLSDPLTHIGNRRKYEKRLAEECARACRYKTPLSLILFDIDHFKQVNDTYGHSIGDEVLKEYTKLLCNALRESDEIFRIGGEEFVVIAPHTNKEEAALLAEKLRKKVEEHKEVVPITASFGVTQYKECEDENTFFIRVDKALYKAKESGRNRVVVL
jgi:diguanylate cyclase (GGDEF)-like protein